MALPNAVDVPGSFSAVGRICGVSLCVPPPLPGHPLANMLPRWRRQERVTMASPEKELVSADAFLAWAATQKERFELVDGRVVRMMTASKQSYNVVAADTLAALLPHARRNGCRTTASDTAVRTGPVTIRNPDVVVDCGPGNPEALEASTPTLVVEVSSPGTSAIDATDKLDEYRSHGDIRLIRFVDPDVISVKLYRRNLRGGWSVEKFDDLDQTIDLAEIGAVLMMGAIYESLEPLPPPHLRLVDTAP
ncbi:Uma2 family endonuclease [Jiella endophytica]|uniref:Uma2 family endonuclease n=1 Tax=Jiella endophytica TaxID=2558362 RepID=A0A4Y8RIW3_9HYPH|nr:Uma2 family endonuclease [Jiella endophytica]TFF22934.1 Uma2 family endonuclease [Jiella endophytica]